MLSSRRKRRVSLKLVPRARHKLRKNFQLLWFFWRRKFDLSRKPFEYDAFELCKSFLYILTWIRGCNLEWWYHGPLRIYSTKAEWVARILVLTFLAPLFIFSFLCTTSQHLAEKFSLNTKISEPGKSHCTNFTSTSAQDKGKSFAENLRRKMLAYMVFLRKHFENWQCPKWRFAILTIFN